MNEVTVFKSIKATVSEPSIALIGKALSMMVPGIGQISIIAADNETAIAVFDKLIGDEFKGNDVNLSGIQDVAIFKSTVLTPNY